MAHDLEQLKQDHPDVAKLFADDWLQYRKSEILPELTREAQSTCDRINRIYFEDTAEAERLFRELVPEAGEGVDFRPPIRRHPRHSRRFHRCGQSVPCDCRSPG